MSILCGRIRIWLIGGLVRTAINVKFEAAEAWGWRNPSSRMKRRAVRNPTYVSKYLSWRSSIIFLCKVGTFLRDYRGSHPRRWIYSLINLKFYKNRGIYWQDEKLIASQGLSIPSPTLEISLKPFYYQLMHIMLKNTELLKHSKITLQHVSVYVETIFRELQSVLG